MIVAYDVNIECDPLLPYKITGQFRSTGADTLKVDPGASYHLYLAFNAHDRSRQSDSVYLGEMAM